MFRRTIHTGLVSLPSCLMSDQRNSASPDAPRPGKIPGCKRADDEAAVARLFAMLWSLVHLFINSLAAFTHRVFVGMLVCLLCWELGDEVGFFFQGILHTLFVILCSRRGGYIADWPERISNTPTLCLQTCSIDLVLVYYATVLGKGSMAP